MGALPQARGSVACASAVAQGGPPGAPGMGGRRMHQARIAGHASVRDRVCEAGNSTRKDGVMSVIRGCSAVETARLALGRCWAFSVTGGLVMIMRITWGKLRAGTWQEYERAYHATVAGKTVPGLRGRWLAQDSMIRTAASQ